MKIKLSKKDKGLATLSAKLSVSGDERLVVQLLEDALRHARASNSNLICKGAN